MKELVGKTVEEVEVYENDHVPGVGAVQIIFTDGTRLCLTSRGCDEGGWMEVSVS